MKPFVYMERHATAFIVGGMFLFTVALFTGYLEVFALTVYALLAGDWVRGKLRERSGADRSTGSR